MPDDLKAGDLKADDLKAGDLLDPASLLQELTTLEQRLHDPSVRRNPAEVTLLLADDFREFGKSGRVYDKTAIVQSLSTEAPGSDEASIDACDFTLTLVNSDAALLTYRSTSAGRTTLRSSLWIHRENGWQMLFHQGTPCT